MNNKPEIAVLLPCYNEANAIADVIAAFHKALPQAAIYVYDNNSTDKTAMLAASAGALVRHEPRQGKGRVVCRMFADIDADIYVLADGDQTYHAASAIEMIEVLQKNRLDMVVGARVSHSEDSTYRAGHQFGNYLFSKIVHTLFGRHFEDVLSGYRVMSKRFVKSFPVRTKGFEIEVQLAIHALELEIPSAEIATPYFSRAEGTNSKLRTYRDGLRILLTILLLFKETKPFKFFSLLAAANAALCLWLGIPVIVEFVNSGLVPRFPTAILATGFAIISSILFAAGVILDTVSRGQNELKRMHYLALSCGDK